MHNLLKSSLCFAALFSHLWLSVVGPQRLIEPQTGKPVLIPTRYEAHRFIATPVTADNVRLSLFTDSAGGLFLYADTAERLKLSIVTLSQKEHEGVRIVGLPNFKSGAMIPPPLGSLFEMRLFVFPRRAANDHGEIDRVCAVVGNGDRARDGGVL